jgi:hypothetical protein
MARPSRPAARSLRYAGAGVRQYSPSAMDRTLRAPVPSADGKTGSTPTARRKQKTPGRTANKQGHQIVQSPD